MLTSTSDDTLFTPTPSLPKTFNLALFELGLPTNTCPFALTVIRGILSVTNCKSLLVQLPSLVVLDST